MASSLVFAATVGLTLGVLFLMTRYIRVRSELEITSAQVEALEQQKADLLRGLERQQFLSRFIRELPLLTEQLHSRVKARRIPGILLQIVLRSFEPGQALVLLRRRTSTSDPRRANRLTVASVHPTSSSIKPGAEIDVGEGELGLVAEAQLTMTREDFERQTTFNRAGLRNPILHGFKPHLAAPMVFDGQTVGVIALSGVGDQGSDAKKALWVIAQIGAVALHNVATFSQMKFTADIDGLTRVYNKRHMISALGEMIYQAQKRLSSLSVFLFDIDNFKNYNDVNGHVEGDKLLKELAGLVKENIRQENLFGRFGGEEFLLILPDASSSDALAVAENIRGRIASHPFAHADKQPLGVVSVSGGVATYPSDAMDSTSLLKAADQALYAAKHGGRNAVLSAQSKYLCEKQPASLAVGSSAPLNRSQRRRFDATIISQRPWSIEEDA